MIKIDNDRDALLTEFGKVTLKEQYCLEGESYQEAFARAAQAFSGEDEELAQRLYDYASKQWFSFATPLLANGGTKRGLPISCFLNYIDDSIEGLTNNFCENAALSTNGGGIGTYWGKVRSVGESTSRGVETPGVMPFMHVQDAQTLAYHQGKTRRGSAATYLDVSHPEIFEFINMRSSTGGDVHRKNENLHHGVNIPDAFMEAVENDGDWQLIDPNSRKVTETVKARKLWITILQQRLKLGEPYIFFIDTANKTLPQSQKEKGLKIHHSNLCTEITLPTNKDRTAVCCLSSLNIAKINEWWYLREQVIEDLITMLDNVITEFCKNAPKTMWRAIHSAESERSLGLGTLGFHTWLQLNYIPIDSVRAKTFNKRIYEEIQKLALKASKKLASERGEPSDMLSTGLRNAHLIAIAPNASSSIICGGVSPSIEPLAANGFIQKTRVGSHLVKNPALVAYLTKIGKNTDVVWLSIIKNKGSVQHLDFIPKHEKSVFKTAREISMEAIVELASDRQQYICQAQSLNLFLPPKITAKELHEIHFSAWKRGLKSLYYLRSSSVKSTNTGEIPNPPKETKTEVCNLGGDCKACEG